MEEKRLVRIALLSLVAGFLHAAVTPAHFDQWWGYGTFFLLAAMAQATYGAALLFPRLLHGEPVTRLWPAAGRRAYYLAGLGGNLAILALYVVTRTVGIPFFGPEAGTVEDVGFLDAFSKLVELALVVLLALQLRSVAPRATPHAA